MKEKVSPNWKKFKKEFGKVYEGTDPDLPDYIAVQDLLFEHVNGSSLDYIANTYQLSPDYVKMVLKEFLGVSPRPNFLGFSPLALTNNKEIDVYKFMKLMRQKKVKEDAKVLYSACQVYKSISEKVEEFYDKN